MTYGFLQRGLWLAILAAYLLTAWPLFAAAPVPQADPPCHEAAEKAAPEQAAHPCDNCVMACCVAPIPAQAESGPRPVCERIAPLRISQADWAVRGVAPPLGPPRG